MAKLVSKTYAQALFELAVEEDKTSAFLEEAAGLLEVLRTNAEFGQFMNHPKIQKEDKLAVVQNVFRDKISREMLGFLVTIVEKDRYTEIEAILEDFVASVKEYNNIGTAYVTTAIAISDQEKQDIESRLLATTRYKTIECIYDVDNSLIGGMVIQMGDRVVDSSIRTKLDKLQRELLAIQL
ncbi:MAG: ATP synthase F1 subunit delta [Lachnospiraceae bacterium]|nr:ATP synthase F1 subunit delta [Lachnospiraceae bacterium]MDE7272279.1 ATP synthase F1 subunit delta [Lachnospiraceae bacterium]